MKKNKIVFGIDFDGVIHNPKNKEKDYTLGKPMEGAKEGMELLHKKGVYIIIFSVKKEKAIKGWMDYFKIPYDKITRLKPEADIYIDDKSYRFFTWELLLDDLGFTKKKIIT